MAELFSTPTGLLSLATIGGAIVMGIVLFRFYLKKMEEEEKQQR